MPESLKHMAEVEHLIDLESLATTPGTVTFPSHLISALNASGVQSRDVRSKIGDYLVSQAEKKARSLGVKNITTFVENGNSAEVVLDHTKHEDIDVIVTGSRGLGNLKNLLLRSVSNKILQLAETTCITVK